MDSAPILQPPNNLPKKLNDCYFFYYSTCKNGDLCQFRHEASALGCEITCLFWKQGKCLNSSCNLRHMELRDRKMIQCYWEDQPSGCQKPHCPFRHKNPKLTAFDLANSVGLFNHNFLNNTTYQDLNASALSELSAVLGTSSLGLEGNLLLPLATSGLSANFLTDTTATQSLFQIKETKIVDSKQRELDKIRMEKVLEKAKEIERQISIFEKDDNDANTKTEGSDTKVTEKVAENKRIKRSSSEKKSSSRKRSRSVSRSRSRSRHRSTSSYRRRSRSPSRHNRSKSRRRTRSRSRSRRYRSRSNDRHRSRSIRRSRTRSRTRSCTPYYKLKIRKEYSDSKVSSTSFNNIDHFVHEQELCS